MNDNLPLLGAHFEAGGRFVMTQYPVSVLISLAYGIVVYAGHPTRLIVGAPAWIDSKLYDIEAKAEGDPPREQMKLMLQSLLADRFKLAAHRETRQLPIYALVVNKPGQIGPQIVLHAADNSTCRDFSPPSTPSPDSPAGPPPCGGGQLMSAGRISGELTMDELAKQISYFQQIDRVVVNRTGLSGVFDFQLDYAPFFWGGPPPVGAPKSNESLPSTIFEALQEQLGLKLKPARGPVDVLVIDHIEMPSPN